ncbi:unnamed protein product [Tilletia controversa]|uniref:Uncharacterized protein n=1 Tax=Tilletia controversa TaxID=13291 RepID=A0A8X7SX67_9BASI|nr:hypothetical protein A4X06_0g4050 [Tilletia controversa]CAD6931392.1 unnamed protein product [Tilletia controversa]CAD6941068.1 unnamed protein product [Tilletia controversa]CAD6945926.1 unnamed protein product [Tilletia controversa]CAD6968671.1 unnamed protein product [Tilletia controversa]
MARKRATAAQKTARAQKKQLALKKEPIDIKPIPTAAPSVAGPSAASSSSNANNPKVKDEKKPAVLVKKDDGDSSMDEGLQVHQAHGPPATPANSARVLPLLTPDSPPNDYGGGGSMLQDEDDGADSDESDYGDGQYGQTVYIYAPYAAVPQLCSTCGTGDNIRARDGVLYCKIHDPLWTMHQTKAIKYFSKYKGVGGNINKEDLMKAENEGQLEVRLRRNPHTGGLPHMRLYWVRQLYELSRAKVAKKSKVLQTKQAEKDQKDAEKLARKVQAERIRAEKKAEKEREKAKKKAQKAAAAANARREKTATGTAGVLSVKAEPGSSDGPSSSAPIDEAGPNSSVTVSSTYIVDMSGDGDDDIDAEAHQASSSSIPAADPQPVAHQGFRVKAEPGLELPMLPPTSDSSTSQVKQELDQPLFRSVE